MNPTAANPVAMQASHGMAADPGVDQMQMGQVYSDPMLQQQQHHGSAEGLISYDTEDLSQVVHYHHSSSGGGGSALLGRKHAPDRRPLRFWQPFNDWWRAELERLGRRPTSQEIGEWYGLSADMVWGETKPSMQETRVHAKCLRSLPLVRDYFRNYRAKKKAKNGDGSGMEGTEDGGDTEDGNDNGTGRRRRNNSRKRAYSYEMQDDVNDPARVAAAMAAAGMAGMDPMEIMQMQQHAGMMLPGQFWAGMEACTDEEYARAVMMHQQMHSVMLQQQMAVAAAAVASQQFPGHQFGVFPAQEDEEEDEDTEPGDGAAAAANVPARSGAPEVVSTTPGAAETGHAEQQEQQQQQQLERRNTSGGMQEGVKLAVPQVRAVLSNREFDCEAAARVLAQAAAAAAAEAERLESAQGDNHTKQQSMTQLQVKRAGSSPLLQPRTEEFSAAVVAAAAAAVAAAADAKQQESAVVSPSTEVVLSAFHQAMRSTVAHTRDLPAMGVPEGASCVVRLTDAEPCMPHSQHKATTTACQDAGMQDASAEATELQQPDRGTGEPGVTSRVAAAEASVRLQSPGSGHAQAMQHAGSTGADGTVTEQPAVSPTPQNMQQQQQQQAVVQAEAHRLGEHDEVSLMDTEQLEHASHEALLEHVKQLQEELVSKRELLKRSFDQLRRTQERLGRRERKLAKEQQKCKQYQQALAAWQASLVPDAAQSQQKHSQDLLSVQMAQMAMAAQAAVAAQGSMVQLQQQHSQQ